MVPQVSSACSGVAVRLAPIKFNYIRIFEYVTEVLFALFGVGFAEKGGVLSSCSAHCRRSEVVCKLTSYATATKNNDFLTGECLAAKDIICRSPLIEACECGNDIRLCSVCSNDFVILKFGFDELLCNGVV